MTDVSGDSADRVTEDALHLALALDSFTSLDWAERLGPAIRRGNALLAALQQRRELLTFCRADDAIIDWLLETISSRLKFLELLHSRNTQSRVSPRAEPNSPTEGILNVRG